MNLRKHKTWCIRSIWGKAIRDGVVSMAESTWYRYAKKLGYSETRKPQKKPRKKGSFNASRPNETWHMDISQYKTLDNVTFYIYTVVDNFSRKIPSWDISTKKCAKIRTETVKQAIKNEFNVDLKNQNLELIVDGGSENNNKKIAEFIKNCHVNIRKKIALKDVTFSNSIVEGPYKIMKSYYFRSKKILSTTIYQEMKFFIEDYDNNRPCYKHKIYTPNEVTTIPIWRTLNWSWKNLINNDWKKTVISVVRFRRNQMKSVYIITVLSYCCIFFSILSMNIFSFETI